MDTDATASSNTELDNAELHQLLRKRSRLRWGLTVLLGGSYLAYALAGHYFPRALAIPFFASAMPWGMVAGYTIILMSIILSVVYVRVVGKLTAQH